MNKKFLALLLSLALCLSLAACGGSDTAADDSAADDTTSDDAAETVTLTVAASPTPHAEILNGPVKKELEKDGWTLEVKEFTDYVQPNNVVESGEIDANYFQHVPYLDDFNAENGTHLVSVLVVHVEPMGLYGGKQTSLDALNK